MSAAAGEGVAGGARRPRLFGEIAVALGFVTPEQLRIALGSQPEGVMIGVLLSDLGYMTGEQVWQVLETQRAERAAAAARGGTGPG